MNKFITSLSPKARGVIWILSWAFLFSLGMTFNKMVSAGVTTPMKVTARTLFGFLFFTPLLFQIKFKADIDPKNVPLQVLRVVVGLFAMACTYYAYTYLHLATATSIGFTAPTMITLLSILFLGDKMRLYKAISIVGGYIGVAIIVQPWKAQVTDLIPVLVALGANLGASITVVLAKVLSRTEKPKVLLMYSNVGITILALAALPFYWHSVTPTDMLKLAGIGLCATLSNYSYLSAIQAANPSFIAPFEYVRLIFALPLGYFILGEVPSINWLLGSIVIIVSTYYLITASNAEKMEDKKPEGKKAKAA